MAQQTHQHRPAALLLSAQRLPPIVVLWVDVLSVAYHLAIPFESLSGMWLLHHFCLRENGVINFFYKGLVLNCLKSWRLPLCQLKMGQSGQHW